MLTQGLARKNEDDLAQAQYAAEMIGYLRRAVLAPPLTRERGHAIFVDAARVWLGDVACGLGSAGKLQLRMRLLLGEALRLDAAGIILAHSHPSGICRPSACDITATHQLAMVARALDVSLVDHLIFTNDAVYSMRAGGLL
jgi:DNA repair protein RadC